VVRDFVGRRDDDVFGDGNVAQGAPDRNRGFVLVRSGRQDHQQSTSLSQRASPRACEPNRMICTGSNSRTIRSTIVGITSPEARRQRAQLLPTVCSMLMVVLSLHEHIKNCIRIASEPHQAIASVVRRGTLQVVWGQHRRPILGEMVIQGEGAAV
jgi:hypothetical protein